MTDAAVKHIGIVACSAEGAALCYTAICQHAARTLGKNNHPRVTLDSIPLAEWMPAFDAGDDQHVAEVMLRSADLLVAAGADLLICPDNSAHRAWPFLHDETPVPFLHIADEVGKEAHRRGLKRIGLLGTRFTMDGPVYPDRFNPIGLDVVIPDADDRAVVDDIIFSELVDGIFTDESRRRCVEIIERLEKKGCDAVALSCTEIPLLIAPHDSPLPTLDSTRLLAAAAVEAACR